MNTLDIEHILKNCPHSKGSFAGVFPSDKLKDIKVDTFPFSLIANTDESDKPGKHWVAFYFDHKGGAEYFDSFGLQPLNENLRTFFYSWGVKHKFNSRQLQGFFSKVCGEYCILFIKSRNKSISLSQFVKFFPGKSGAFDSTIIDLFKGCSKYYRRANLYCQSCCCFSESVVN